MESMDTLKKSAMLARLRNSKGFSLIEMAIVLVIIGIIIGAIIKGQDLIVNSRAKQVVSAMNSWRNLSFAYLDRNGRFPGDGGKTGYIAAFPPYSSATVEISHTMSTAPANPVVVGGSSFYIYFGNTGTHAAPGKNVLVVCSTAKCDKAFTADELEIIKTVDTSMDGAADAGVGQVRGSIITTPDPSASNPVGFADSSTPTQATVAGSTELWGSAAYTRAIWAFDKPF